MPTSLETIHDRFMDSLADALNHANDALDTLRSEQDTSIGRTATAIWKRRRDELRSMYIRLLEGV